MTVTIIGSATLISGIRYVSFRFDYAKTFEHMSPLTFLYIILCVPFISAGFAFLVSLWYRLATITLDEDAIHGRSYWGRKNKIPLHDITKLTPFSNNGIKAIVVNSKHHGQIYISDKTERLPELLDLLAGYLPDQLDGKSL
jgi:hypothetical protein